jgi:hypothetical protein
MRPLYQDVRVDLRVPHPFYKLMIFVPRTPFKSIAVELEDNIDFTNDIHFGPNPWYVQII